MQPPLELDRRMKVESAAKLTEMASEDSSYVVCVSKCIYVCICTFSIYVHDLCKHTGMAKFSL